jgi:hypothetical protein
MAQRLRLETLRKIKLPAAVPDEPDHVTALRKTLEFHQDSSPSRIICVPDEIASMEAASATVSDEPPAPKAGRKQA